MQDEDDCDLRTACYNGHLEMVKKCIEKARTDSVDSVSEIATHVVKICTMQAEVNECMLNMLWNKLYEILITANRTHVKYSLHEHWNNVKKVFKTMLNLIQM